MIQFTISIHAPVKGATLKNYRTAGEAGISIHAPVKGATISVSKKIVALSNFNPRSREGSDFFKEHYTAYAVKISIHAPVKGATPGLYDIEL